MEPGIIDRVRSAVHSIESLAKTVPDIRRRLARNEKLLLELRELLKPAPAAKPQTTVPDISFQELPANVIQCPMCGSGAIKWASAYPSNHARFRMAVVLYCAQCGSGHVPDADVLVSGYYTQEYSTTNRGDRDIDPERYFADANNPKLVKYFARANAQIEALGNAGATFRRVLDYGSGPGYLLYASKAPEKFAVEFDAASDKYLNYLGVVKLQPTELPEGFFDVIVASHVVEHFTASTMDTLLRSMLRSLSDTGLLLVEVPQGGHTFARLKSRQDPHTLFFTPEGLRRAVRNAGALIVREYCRGESDGGPATQQVYFPDESDPFANSRRGGITVIVRNGA